MAGKKRIAPVFRPEETGLRKVFGDLEAVIMETLWKQGQGTVSEVYKAVARQRDLTYTTVKTIMERLAEKGYLHCDSRQRAYLYTPIQSRDAFVQQVSETVVRGLLTDFGGTLSAHLLEATVSQCDVSTLEHLQALIDARRRSTAPSAVSSLEHAAADHGEFPGGGDAS